ncbi:exonuclease 1 isoform X1 [Thunnus maccoyii]|uniref:exonuclease 1 isoform X1 n=1 Tax=Thunnus maccoyii TaxID=8240 RepID=UPI001C4D8CA7|nr:exonuclease 1 isoform X1 [Thunnus maccoyii]XP_042290355.1 exonuclease 1 isoform X1 [Thunnus maccoyii]
MGIPGLLQFIKDAGEPVNVKKYKGQTVAVDTYCWLHKGAFSCAEKLAKGEPTDQYVWYCMKFVDMLLTFSVKPILVFDGRNLPSKKEVEKARRERREANLQKGRQLLREGKLSEARDCFTRCVNITPAMAHNLIKAARARGVDCVVAPYEADAQLAYLTKSGLAQAVITEDSDLLAFGCKKVILKMDKQGNGLEIDQSNLGRCRSLGNVFTEEKFRHMCILSGCDYLASLHGIGLGKACKLLRLAKDPDILKVIRKMGQYLKMSLVVPEQYIEGFTRANNTFLYQLVFDPVRRKVVPLNPYPEHVDPATLSYAGLNVGDDKGLQMALGNLDINTMERIDDFSPDKPMTQPSKPRSCSWNASPASTGPSIWSRSFRPASAAPPQPAASPDRPLSTRGKERVVHLDGLRLPCRELQVKRPRDDSSISDLDVLQQYSSSSQKRSRSDQRQDKRTPASQPRPRNRFATLLQRRNQEAEEDGQATCSRFFSSSSSAASLSTKQSVQEDLPQSVSPTQDKSPPSIQTNDSDGPDVPSLDTPSPPQTPSSTPPCSASQGLGLFDWSGSSPSTEQSKTPKSTSGLAVLQLFQYKRESFSSTTKTQKPSRDTSPPHLSSTDRNPEDKDDLPDSPPSQDSAYFSQSQTYLTTFHKEEAPTYNFSNSYQEDAASNIQEMNSSKDLESEQSPAHSTEVDKKPSILKSKVAGLLKPKSSSQGQVTKVRALGPARASGLRKKSANSGKKISSPNNENNPGVQATISSLWKNFSFKKDTQNMTPCKTGEPMSPVKDNLLANSPQTDTNLITSF